jgi:hypothetical protein
VLQFLLKRPNTLREAPIRWSILLSLAQRPGQAEQAQYHQNAGKTTPRAEPPRDGGGLLLEALDLLFEGLDALQ